jgi:hypothetical protein
MSPWAPKVKCPHGRGQNFHESEATAAIPSLKSVESGTITLREAAEMIGESYRHAKRINKKVHEKGARGLIHGNTGRSPGNCIPVEVKKKPEICPA